MADKREYLQDFSFRFMSPKLESLKLEELRAFSQNLMTENSALSRDLRRHQAYLDRLRSLGKTMKAMKNVRQAERFKLEKYMKLLLDHSNDIVLFLDGDNRLVYCTRVFVSFFEIESFEVINGRALEEVCQHFGNAQFTERLKDALQDVKETHRAAAALNEQIEILNKDGVRALRTYIVTVTPLVDDGGEFGGAIITCHDITDMQARILAEDANSAKDQFIASVSHELRTPLNAILGLSELEMRKKLPTDTASNLEKIYAAGQNLLSLINDVLDVSKIDSGQFELAETDYDFAEMISEALCVNAVRIASKPIVFNVEVDDNIPSRLYGDETRVKQILNNLLSNAVKFTESGSVTLRASCQRTEGGARFTYVVSDTGRGIREEHIGKLFKNYSQVDSPLNHKVEGTGLGLSICKSLAEMMGGMIAVSSEYGKGTSFSVSILQKVADETPIGAEMIQDLQKFRLIKNFHGNQEKARLFIPKGKVLVVDDVITNLDVAKGLMTPYGLTVHCASSGWKAIEAIQESGEKDGERYDIIFMDHMMPELDGLETVDIIRGNTSDAYAKTVPIVMLTANAVAGRREAFLQRGANDFLAKPIDIIQLENILKTWIPKEKQAAPPEAGEPADAPVDLEEADFDGIEGVDVRHGLANMGDSMELYRSILLDFCRDADEEALKIRESKDTGNIALYTISVHGLKGASRTIGALALGDFAEQMETAGKNKDTATINARTEEFLSVLRGLTGSIRGVLQKWEEGREMEALDPSLAAELRDALVNVNIARVNRLLTKYLEIPLNQETRNAMSEIEQYVLLYEYDQAVKILDSFFGVPQSER